MTRVLWYEGKGIYVPIVEHELVEWIRDRTGNPLMGVHIYSPRHGQLIADVWIQTGKSRLSILLQKRGRVCY